ncbi:MAG: hypothetical protein H6R07_1177 [Proteobacteria bacterium]|nr:hypothetical protein [Pseudomonadota bacterium]
MRQRKSVVATCTIQPAFRFTHLQLLLIRCDSSRTSLNQFEQGETGIPSSPHL